MARRANEEDVATVSTLSLTVPEELAGERLDVVVARLAPRISRRQARRLVDDGAVFVDGKRVQVCSRAMRGGSVVEVAVPAGAPRPRAQPGIVRLDAELVVADKPAGVPTEPTREGSRGTLQAALVELLREQGEDARYLHAVHRLDTDTTGVVVFARSAAAARHVGKQLHDGTAERRYLALVEGVPAWTRMRLDQPLTRARDGQGKVQVDPQGVPALTLATVLAPGTRGSLVLCTPRTGRTHQLRVHLAHAGHALVGDRRYGPASPGGRPRPPRTDASQAHLGLHALSLAFAHPDGELVYLSAPPPEGFLVAAEAWGVPRSVVLDVAERLATPSPPPLVLGALLPHGSLPAVESEGVPG